MAGMTVLERVFASGGTEVVIPTLEITCAAWAAPILLCGGFENHTCTTEDARSLTFVASAIAVALPKRNTSGTQSLTFAIDNVTGEAQRLIDAAIEARERVFITFRHYLSSDKTAPAEAPIRLIVRDGEMVGGSLRVTASFFDLINTAWPRRFYTPEFAPGLKYFK
jgi:hypothetical protein